MKYSFNFIGYTGFCMSLLTTFGGMFTSFITDKYFPRNKKTIVVLFYMISSAIFFTIIFCTKSPFFDDPPLKVSSY